MNKFIFSPSLDCEKSKIATIISEFDEEDEAGLVNTIMTNLESQLPDSIFSFRTSGFQDRNIDQYKAYINQKFFKNKCDSTGLYVNGFINKENNVFNFYATNVGLQIHHPEYLNANQISIATPEEIDFTIRNDAEFVASFIRLLLISTTEQDHQKIIKETYEFQNKYNISLATEKKFGSKSILAHVYLIRANSYAIEGNDKRAKQFYDASSKIGNNEVSKISNTNRQNVQSIADVMYSDPELRKLRVANIQRHNTIESNFMKFVREVGKVIDRLFRSILR